ncbi:MAG: DUF6361 family protein [Gammaproteobacteria bacterium]|nr:DUF6361 family protein [Gammaproteobacteria bacterium]
MKNQAQSKLAWVDHDSAARERSLQIIGLFGERDSRDELGLGAIRDSFSDRLFPGTSTIQTRLRYMLIIPWIFKKLEMQRIPSSEIEARARRFELQLIKPLTESDDSLGTFGAGAGQGLKRLPSDVYWAGLGDWGIRRFGGSINDYFGSLDQIYAVRKQTHVHGDDAIEESDVLTWHPHLPDPPENFPWELSFALTRQEAEFLCDAIVTAAGESLLGWLVREKRRARADRPWEHPDLARFPESIRELLQHAQLFSEVMRGAAILYNLMLAEIDSREDIVDEHRVGISDWASELDGRVISEWSLPDLWRVVRNPRHAIKPGACRFVEKWVQYVGEDPHGVVDNKEARRLVQMREQALKKNRSRFVNARAREQWSGYAGIRPMTFRWPIAQTCLEDLAHGFRRG